MTITNKKRSAVPFNGSKHFSAHEKVRFPPNDYSEGGERSGLVRAEGKYYLVRLKSNPHLAQWVVFGKENGN